MKKVILAVVFWLISIFLLYNCFGKNSLDKTSDISASIDVVNENSSSELKTFENNLVKDNKYSFFKEFIYDDINSMDAIEYRVSGISDETLSFFVYEFENKENAEKNYYLMLDNMESSSLDSWKNIYEDGKRQVTIANYSKNEVLHFESLILYENLVIYQKGLDYDKYSESIFSFYDFVNLMPSDDATSLTSFDDANTLWNEISNENEEVGEENATNEEPIDIQNELENGISNVLNETSSKTFKDREVSSLKEFVGENVKVYYFNEENNDFYNFAKQSVGGDLEIVTSSYGTSNIIKTEDGYFVVCGYKDDFKEGIIVEGSLDEASFIETTLRDFGFNWIEQ